MGKYSSDSDSSYQGKKSRKKRSSSVSSTSSSHYSSRKSKKSKRGRRSRSRDRDKRSKRSSRDRSRTRHRRSRSHSRHRHRRKHSRSRSASSSRSKHKSHKSRSASPSKSSDSRNKKSPESSYSGRDATQKAMSPFSKKMASSDSSRRRSVSPVRNTDDELLQRLNAHAVQAMVENAKTRVQNLVEEQANRQSAVIDINAPNFAPKAFTSSQKDKDEDPVIVQPAPLQTPNTNVIEIENERNILSPNVILEDETAKLNRWIKKLYLIRQRAINGEMISSY